MDNSVSDSGGIFPKFLSLLFFVEMWERFSYYGMRCLLILFLTSHFGFEDKNAYAIYSLFAAISYAGPIFGGMLADKIMGFRSMVLLGGIVITLGHITMVFASSHEKITFLGLSLIAVGTGLFKGNITNLLGACYKEGDTRRSQGFTLFYMSVNVGSFVSSIACGYVATVYGWDYGFGLAGVGMIAGLFVFVKFQNILADIGLSTRLDLLERRFLGLKPFSIIFIGSIALAILLSEALAHSVIFANMLKYFGLLILVIFIYMLYCYKDADRRNLFILAIMMVFLMIFYALEMQLGSLINLFAERNVEKEVLGLMIPASASQAINPISVVICGFVFSIIINLGKNWDVLRIFFATLTMAICFFVLYYGCLNAGTDGQVSYIYLVIGISFMGLGEIFIAPIVQSYTSLLAPKKIKGFIMGMSLMALAFSNLAGIIISEFMSVPSVSGEVDVMESLVIYQSGFLDIAKFNIYVAIIFIPFGIYMHKALNLTSEESEGRRGNPEKAGSPRHFVARDDVTSG